MCSLHRTTSCPPAAPAVTARDASRAISAATLWWCWATWVTGLIPKSRPPFAGPSPTPTPCSGPTPSGPQNGSAGQTSSPRNCVGHVLVTNDFPPKLGGIQSYLWELWRRLPPDRVAGLTPPYGGDAPFCPAQPFRVDRTTQRVLFPTRAVAARVNALAEDTKASLAVLDPA